MTRPSPSPTGCSSWRRRPTPQRSSCSCRIGCGSRAGGQGFSRLTQRTEMRRSTLIPLVVAALGVVLAAGVSRAQPESPPDRTFGQPIDSRPTEEKRQLQKQCDDAFERSDWPAAEVALRRLTEIDKK